MKTNETKIETTQLLDGGTDDRWELRLGKAKDYTSTCNFHGDYEKRPVIDVVEIRHSSNDFQTTVSVFARDAAIELAREILRACGEGK